MVIVNNKYIKRSKWGFRQCDEKICKQPLYGSYYTTTSKNYTVGVTIDPEK